MARGRVCNMLKRLADIWGAFRATLLRVADHHQLLARVPTPPDGDPQFADVLLHGVFRLRNKHSGF